MESQPTINVQNGGVVVSFYIYDGYSFRNTLGIIKAETEIASMILSKDAIEISFRNRQGTTLHSIRLNTAEFTSYEYNIVDPETGHLMKEYPIAFETKELFNTTKGIGRRDSIRIYLLQGNSKLNIQQIKAGAKDPGKSGALFVNILTAEHRRFDSPDGYTQEPNIRIQAKEFADLCGQLSGLKCSSLQIIGKVSGVTFKGVKPNKTFASITHFSNNKPQPSNNNTNSSSNNNINHQNDFLNSILDTVQNTSTEKRSNVHLQVSYEDEIISVELPSSTAKALSKIHNISPSGTLLQFTFVKGKPIKIVSPIGIYGVYTLYIR